MVAQRRPPALLVFAHFPFVAVWFVNSDMLLRAARLPSPLGIFDVETRFRIVFIESLAIDQALT